MLNIAERRKQLELTQAELADKLGIKQNTVAGWETGYRKPGLDMLIKLTEIFGCTVDDLIKK